MANPTNKQVLLDLIHAHYKKNEVFYTNDWLYKEAVIKGGMNKGTFHGAMDDLVGHGLKNAWPIKPRATKANHPEKEWQWV
ncbi:hypothetical protein IMAU10585_01687 [Lactiplantibacillus plantarum]|uniref:hypothetical protein n=1 Tax=Lactiplantibacillus plantarum TaxID=1590 RepID=UPI000932FC1A|nr:hypothetical protein [Lactiplantibacillus plantarum]MBO2714938.1 hypothetical protein [Lactiplantibacillus plantarum]MCG0758388.1 hypothetical protein [Lactiplantibacillus plantarum]MCG0775670.1 hypothetical protein [Lactiplantibacillus plantarum]MCG0868588.1 hypothetical protein [Lactiplantibacillus plantarum]QGX70002.1 hypothetical protein GPK32_14380 [Lactiplantibacillus plantarum]